MSTKTLRLFIGIISLLVSGFSFADSAKEQSMSTLQQAKAAYSKVDKTGFAWSNSKDMIKNAEKAAADGDYAKASEEAQKALDESNNAWQQYMDNKDAGTVTLKF